MAKLNKKKKFSPLKAAVAGVALGAAAGAAAYALKDKKSRDNLKKSLKELQQKGEKGLLTAKKLINKAKEESKEKLAKELKKTIKKVA